MSEVPWYTMLDLISFYIGITGMSIGGLYFLAKYIKKKVT